MNANIIVVGAGLTGMVVAEQIASRLKEKVLVLEKRKHIGGNCYDYHNTHGIIIQRYGPHAFHTKNKKVWDYVAKFSKFNNYKHKVLAFYKGQYYPVPINLTTVNKYFKITLKNSFELKRFLRGKIKKVKKIRNSRDVIESKFGTELYNVFFKDYSKKQWDKYPEELDKSVFQRLPIKYDSDPYYFNDKYQGMPVGGFSHLFKKMALDSNISIKLNTDFFKIRNKLKFKYLIYTGRIDQFFDFKYGELEYRCIKCWFRTYNKSSLQPTAQVNFPDRNTTYSRVTEFKKFYRNISPKTTICKETFDWNGDLAYPVLTKENAERLKRYKRKAKQLKNIFFAGRLAEYRYLNMDQAIEAGLNCANKCVQQYKNSKNK